MKVLIAHADLSANGGAESYARAIVDRLRLGGHTIGVLDITGHRPDDAAMSDPVLFRLGRMAGLARLTLWKYALVCRALPRVAAEYDYAILSFGEGPELLCPSLHIRHAPAVFSSQPDMLAVLGARKPTLLLRKAYVHICRWIAGLKMQPAPSVRTITNTRWTANMALTHCNIEDSIILYPKVTHLRFADDTTQRDPFRMIAVGRIVPNKRLEETVAVLDELRKDGLPATLQIIGRADSPYAQRFLLRYRSHAGLILSPNADQATLMQALALARVGIHPYRSEHFGIAVAEMICAGVLPLVHNSGGVCELVQNPDLRFCSESELTEKAAHLMRLSAPECEGISTQLRDSEALNQALDFDAQLDKILAQELVA